VESGTPPCPRLAAGRSRGANTKRDGTWTDRDVPLKDPERLQAVADVFTAKYGSATWHFVVRDGAFSHAEAGCRALVFCVRPVRGLGFRKGEHSSQTTWTFPS
jgi:hypothetical protein